MNLQSIQIILDINGNIIDTNYNPVRAHSNYRHIVQVVAPNIQTDSCAATFSGYAYEIGTKTLNLRLAHTGAEEEKRYIKGSDVVSPQRDYYDQVSDYNVWERELTDTVVSMISKINAGKFKVVVSFSQYVVDSRGINELGTFGSNGSTVYDLPLDGQNTNGDFYILDTLEYTSTNTGLRFNYRDTAIYRDGRWIKGQNFIFRNSTSPVSITVDPSMKLVYEDVDHTITEDIIGAISENSGNLTYLSNMIDDMVEDGTIYNTMGQLDIDNGTNESKVLSGWLLKSNLSNKVDKEVGKDLSSNDYTNSDKLLVNTIENKVDKVIGKDLSDENYTLVEKNKLDELYNPESMTIYDISNRNNVGRIIDGEFLANQLDQYATNIDLTDNIDTIGLELAKKATITSMDLQLGYKVDKKPDGVNDLMIGNKINQIYLDVIDPGEPGDPVDSAVKSVNGKIGIVNLGITDIPDLQQALNLKLDVSTHENDKSALEADISTKVDKVTGKGLSDLNYTQADKNLVDTIEDKIDAIPGKGLSSNDYTDSDKLLVNTIEGKVDKVVGKGLSSNDYDIGSKEKVDTLNITGDGTKYLADDGTYKLVESGSGGSSFNRVMIFDDGCLLCTQMLYDGEKVIRMKDRDLRIEGEYDIYDMDSLVYSDLDLHYIVPLRYVQTTSADFDASGDYTGTEEYIILPSDKTGDYQIINPVVIGVATNGDYLTSTQDMFRENPSLHLELDYLDTSNVTNMSRMFYLPQATTLDLSSFDTSNVTVMDYMFYGSQVTTLDLSSFDTSNVSRMDNMFNNSQVTTLDLSSFDTSNVSRMDNMFNNSQATTLDLSSFDTSNVTVMDYMFYRSQVTTLDLSSFDTSNVTNMSRMFYLSQATTGYARTQTDADNFNSSPNKPAALVFEVI